MSTLINYTRVTLQRTSPLARVVCCVLCVLLLLGSMSFSPRQEAVQAQTVDELNAEKNALAQKQEELEAQRDETAATLEAQQAQNELLLSQIETQSQKIGIHEQLIAQFDTQIAEKTAKIAEQDTMIAKLEVEVKELFQTLRNRLRALSKTNTASSGLQMLIDSKSYTDYLISFKMSERISMHDQQMMDTLETSIVTLTTAQNQNKNDKASLEIERAKADREREEMQADKQALQALYAEKDVLAQSIAQNIENLDEQIEKINAQQAYLQGVIDDVMAQIRAEEERRRQEEEERRRQEEEEKRQQEANKPDGEDPSEDSDEPDDDEGGYEPPKHNGTMVWPAPTCKVITSSYGYRPEFGQNHRGIDIACYGSALGQPIVAAASGTVVYANRYDEWGGGFGYFVMIDHGYDANGQRIITVYAHCNEVIAYAGQEVDAGELIAYIGNTGDSYGAHLHFEVQVDGCDANPMAGYLPLDGVDIYG